MGRGCSCQIQRRLKKDFKRANKHYFTVPVSLMYLLDPAIDVSVVTDSFIEDESPWDFDNMRSKEGFEPSAFLHVQEFCCAESLNVPSDVWSVQKLLKYQIGALDFNEGGRISIVELKTVSIESGTESRTSLQASRSKRLELKHRVQNVDLNKHAVDDL